jgi:hypothetical protein
MKGVSAVKRVDMERSSTYQIGHEELGTVLDDHVRMADVAGLADGERDVLPRAEVQLVGLERDERAVAGVVLREASAKGSPGRGGARTSIAASCAVESIAANAGALPSDGAVATVVNAPPGPTTKLCTPPTTFSFVA